MYSWTPVNSPLNHMHPVTKSYVLLFVVLFVVFLGNIYILAASFLSIAFIVIFSKVPLRLIWNSIKTYVILLIPFVLLLSWFDNPEIRTMVPTATIIYIRFLSVFIVGTVYSLTTNYSDISLYLLRYKSLRKFGIALACGFSSIAILDKKIKNIIMVQKLRGITLSLNPLKFNETFISLQALLIPTILQTVEISQEFSDALVARGYNLDREIELPPNLKFSLNDIVLIILSNLILILVLKEMLI